MRTLSNLIPIAALAAGLLAPACHTPPLTAAPPTAVVYETDIRPLLVARCGRCPAGGKTKGSLDFWGAWAANRRGSESGGW
ncbi:MAG: hypothetical protein Ct9H300mP1_04970 [Planctomycetaceae bacterium]|nr:MAG: hypothetical protein Ct9H300mP1_04970 [Planctomycetaceae bacterium]